LVSGQVEILQRLEVPDPTACEFEVAGEKVVVQVESFQSVRQMPDVSNKLDLVFAQNEHSEIDDALKVCHFWELVLAEVQKVEVWKRNKVLNLGDEVVLKAEIAHFFLTFEQWDVLQISVF